jgi:hypothetical protein
LAWASGLDLLWVIAAPQPQATGDRPAPQAQHHAPRTTHHQPPPATSHQEARLAQTDSDSDRPSCPAPALS